jgi:hypothetical protein
MPTSGFVKNGEILQQMWKLDQKETWVRPDGCDSRLDPWLVDQHSP